MTQQLFNPSAGPTRERIEVPDFLTLAGQAVTLDERRRRPYYFDGRFLTARDLTSEQNYALVRQADLGRASGGGVIAGLEVAAVVPSGRGSGRELIVAAGRGITPAGELVSLSEPVQVRAANIPGVTRVDASLGIRQLPDEPVGSRSGVYVLLARPVEYTDNPEVAYSTGINDRRRLEHGEVVEAVALTLVALEESSTDTSIQVRGRLARSFFLQGAAQQLSSEALPLAIVALNAGRIAWIDNDLVRRELGADSVLGFGLGQLSTRHAFLRQYSVHLSDVEKERNEASVAAGFAAASYFRALPPFGALPRQSIQVVDGELRQAYFPPDFNVELTLIPEDELPALAEEASNFAPIDLEQPASSRETIPVMICVPLRQDVFNRSLTEFDAQEVPPLTPRLNRPTQQLQPIEALDALRRKGVPSAPSDALVPHLALWARAVERAPRLYYFRRRQIPTVSYVVPRFAPVGTTDPTAAWTVARPRLVAAGELDGSTSDGQALLLRLDFILRRTFEAGTLAASQVIDEVRVLFERAEFAPASSGVARLLIKGAVAELAFRVRTSGSSSVISTESPALQSGASARVRVRPLRSSDVQSVSARFRVQGGSGALGDGYQTLVGVEPRLDDPATVDVVSRCLAVPELDGTVLGLSSAEVAPFAAALLQAADEGDMQAIRALAGVEA